jgi:hypothetical protein
MRVVFIAVVLSLTPTAQAATLHCLAGPPGLMLTLSGDTARLDYLGDGRFALSPPLDAPPATFSRHAIATAGGALPIFLRREACRVMGLDLPFAVELGIPTDEGRSPVRGCCREIAE